jgi:hypothetical protein
MRATPEQMELVAYETARRLFDAGLLPREKGSLAEAVVRQCIQREKDADDELEREAHELMRRHAGAAGSGDFDARAVFLRIKKKLAAEKGIVV